MDLDKEHEVKRIEAHSALEAARQEWLAKSDAWFRATAEQEDVLWAANTEAWDRYRALLYEYDNNFVLTSLTKMTTE